MLRVVVLATLLQSIFAQQLKLATNYSGNAFFDLWNYKVGNDATNYWGEPANQGNVNFTDQAFAQEQRLLFVNSVGNVIVKLDNFTSATPGGNYGRNSVQLLSKEQITPGSLVIMDAVHMAFGCSVWPSFWMTGGPNWPLHGEIDIVENVNLAPNNAYSLHTESGCAATSQVSMTGNLVSTDCFNGTNFDEGCKVVDNNQSFGSGFASNGGGAFALLWNDDGIKIWFFTRSAIPSDLPTANPNPAGWGKPTAFYSSSTCDTTKFFGPQTMILEIDVCGDFALNAFNATCSGVAAQCVDLVTNPTFYDNAYFEIRYITVFSNSTTGSSTIGSPTTGSPTTGSSTATGSTNGGSSTGISTPGTSTTPKSAGRSMKSLDPFSIVAGIVVLLLAFISL